MKPRFWFNFQPGSPSRLYSSWIIGPPCIRSFFKTSPQPFAYYQERAVCNRVWCKFQNSKFFSCFQIFHIWGILLDVILLDKISKYITLKKSTITKISTLASVRRIQFLIKTNCISVFFRGIVYLIVIHTELCLCQLWHRSVLCMCKLWHSVVYLFLFVKHIFVSKLILAHICVCS